MKHVKYLAVGFMAFAAFTYGLGLISDFIGSEPVGAIVLLTVMVGGTSYLTGKTVVTAIEGSKAA